MAIGAWLLRIKVPPELPPVPGVPEPGGVSIGAAGAAGGDGICGT